jgi:hypothetical protein
MPAADRSNPNQTKKARSGKTEAGFFMRYIDLDQKYQDEPAEYLLCNTAMLIKKLPFTSRLYTKMLHCVKAACDCDCKQFFSISWRNVRRQRHNS